MKADRERYMAEKRQQDRGRQQILQDAAKSRLNVLGDIAEEAAKKSEIQLKESNEKHDRRKADEHFAIIRKKAETQAIVREQMKLKEEARQAEREVQMRERRAHECEAVRIAEENARN